MEVPVPTIARTPVWLWINLLSLDAPIVAVAWQDFLARSFPAILHPQARWVLGLTVWAIYIADRLLDVRGSVFLEESLRHRFYRANRRLATFALALILCSDFLVTAMWLRPAVFHNGTVVALAAIGYLYAFTKNGARGLFWKKACAALLFAAGVFLVSWTGTSDTVALIWPAVSFTLLCGGNLFLIECWERKWHTGLFGLGLLLFAFLCFFEGQRPWYRAVAFGGGGLAVLALLRPRISNDARRALADLVLIAPLLLQ